MDHGSLTILLAFIQSLPAIVRLLELLERQRCARKCPACPASSYIPAAADRLPTAHIRCNEASITITIISASSSIVT